MTSNLNQSAILRPNSYKMLIGEISVEVLQRFLHRIAIGQAADLVSELRTLHFQVEGLLGAGQGVRLQARLVQLLELESELPFGDERIRQRRAGPIDFLSEVARVDRAVVRHPQVVYDVVEGLVLLFHLLMVRAALVGGPAAQKISHRLEDLVHAPHLFVLEMHVVDLQEPVVLLLLL